MNGGPAKTREIPQRFDKAHFYAIMKSGDLDDVNNEMEEIGSGPASEKEGYEGALLIKKAGLVKKPKERLNLFKAGRVKLEASERGILIRSADQPGQPRAAEDLVNEAKPMKTSPGLKKVVNDFFSRFL